MAERVLPAGDRAVLESLCREVGVEPSYRSGGHVHHAPTESLLHAVRALGVLVNDAGDAARALRTERRRSWSRPLEPVTVSWEGGPAQVELRLPGPPGDEPVEVRLEREDGTTAEARVDPDRSQRPTATVEGRVFHTVRAELPGSVPPGYHDVHVRCGAVSAETRLIRAPRRVWSPDAPAPRWGSFLPLYAVRSRGSGGTGDLGDLRRLMQWTGEEGGSLVGTLPLYPLFLGEEELEPAPYSPVSRLFWNELYLDVEELPGLENAPEARRILESTDFQERLRELEAGRRVDYRQAMEAKRRILRAAARAFQGPGMGDLDFDPIRDGEEGSGPGGATADSSRALLDYARGHPDALDYARFRTLGEERRTTWPEWPPEARYGELDPWDQDPDRVRYHLYAQWALDRQMDRLAQESGAGLYLDFPLGSHPRGYDVWRHRSHFAEGVTTGAPPDAFYSEGQDWAFPPLHPRGAREEGHSYWIRCLRHVMSVSDAVRIDHVMGLHRLYWVPEGRPATEGVYVRYPVDELYAVLCLESHRNRCEVVGEDLGTVPAEVPEAMDDHGLASMWVLPFEVGPGDPGEEPRYRAPEPRELACLDTHDLPPFAAFWKGTDIDREVEAGLMAEDQAARERAHRARWREALTEVLGSEGVPAPADPSTEEALEASLRLLAGSPARLLLVNLEDLWLEEEPQNVPGTTGSHNWTLRAPMLQEEMERDDRVRTLLSLVDRMRSDSKTSTRSDS